MDEAKYKYAEVPSITYLNELLGNLVQGRATDEEKALIRHLDAMVTEGVDMGIIVRHRDLHKFDTWINDVQTVMLKSANDGALIAWTTQYDAECKAHGDGVPTPPFRANPVPCQPCELTHP